MSASNAIIKAKVARAELCYICERRPPTPERDEYGGYSCQPCRASIARIRRKYALNGYRERAPRRDAR